MERAVAAAVLVLVPSACADRSDEAELATPDASAAIDDVGSELAGVKLDVRRDPG